MLSLFSYTSHITSLVGITAASIMLSGCPSFVDEEFIGVPEPFPFSQIFPFEGSPTPRNTQIFLTNIFTSTAPTIFVTDDTGTPIDVESALFLASNTFGNVFAYAPAAEDENARFVIGRSYNVEVPDFGLFSRFTITDEDDTSTPLVPEMDANLFISTPTVGSVAFGFAGSSAQIDTFASARDGNSFLFFEISESVNDAAPRVQSFSSVSNFSTFVEITDSFVGPQERCYTATVVDLAGNQSESSTASCVTIAAPTGCQNTGNAQWSFYSLLVVLFAGSSFVNRKRK